jgi:hypothetical protein
MNIQLIEKNNNRGLIFKYVYLKLNRFNKNR